MYMYIQGTLDLMVRYTCTQTPAHYMQHANPTMYIHVQMYNIYMCRSTFLSSRAYHCWTDKERQHGFINKEDWSVYCIVLQTTVEGGSIIDIKIKENCNTDRR